MTADFTERGGSAGACDGPTRGRRIEAGAWLALLIAALTACGGGGGQVASGPSGNAPEASSPEARSLEEDDADGTASAGGDRLDAALFFADDSGSLRPERRDLPLGGTPARRARRVVEALLQGPQSRSLHPTVPAAAGLREVYVDDDGTAYVDLDANFRRTLSHGSQDALLAIWSLTNTLAINFPDIHRVKILLEGEEVQDLGGHLDLSRAFLPDLGLVGGRVNRVPSRAKVPGVAGRRIDTGAAAGRGAP